MSAETKVLGKIHRAVYGFGGYQDAQFGFTLTFTLAGGGQVAWFDGYFPASRTDETARRIEQRVIQTLKAAKKSSVHELVGVPVEVTFHGNPACTPMKDWRVLEEVL